MLRRIHLLFPIVLLAAGCTPSARFTSAVCSPELEKGELQSVRFRSSFETMNLNQQQLVYEVGVLDGHEQPVRSETGRYKDAAGNLKAVRTVMVLDSPWKFEDLEMAIPSVDLEAVSRQGPAFAEFRISTVEGQMLAAQRIPLPPPYAANVRATSRPAPTREAAPPSGRESPTATTRRPASRPATREPASQPVARARPTPPPAEEWTKESERGKPIRKGEPPPLRPVGGSGSAGRETPSRPAPSPATPKSSESRDRIMAGSKENQPDRRGDATSRPTSRPASQPASKPAASAPTSRPSKPRY